MCFSALINGNISHFKGIPVNLLKDVSDFSAKRIPHLSIIKQTLQPIVPTSPETRETKLDFEAILVHTV